MRLDFAILTQPSAKTRGQAGTSGTQASTRVCVSPPAKHCTWTGRDKPTAAVLVSEPILAIPAAHPRLSPACPLTAGSEKLNGCVVSPAAPHVPTNPMQVAAADVFEREDLVGKPADASFKICEDCLLSSLDEADMSLAPFLNDAEIEAFTARVERFLLRGRADANELAERLTRRDREGDDRRLCLECTWLGDAGRCLAAATGRLPGADRRFEPMQTILQRCEAFGLRKELP